MIFTVPLVGKMLTAFAASRAATVAAEAATAQAGAPGSAASADPAAFSRALDSIAQKDNAKNSPAAAPIL